MNDAVSDSSHRVQTDPNAVVVAEHRILRMHHLGSRGGNGSHAGIHIVVAGSFPTGHASMLI